jgi:hypothetical protein
MELLALGVAHEGGICRRQQLTIALAKDVTMNKRDLVR